MDLGKTLSMIQIPISVGELLDKITILYIKNSKIKDKEKLKKIEKELLYLIPIGSPFLMKLDLYTLYTDLMDVNFSLWEIEDKLRELEKLQEFDEVFIYSARQVYKLNDQRFSLKNQINQLTESDIFEVKEYIKY
jgi:hypothetical protein